MNADFLDLRVFEANFRDELRKSFDEEKRRCLDRRKDVLLDGAVVRGVFELVGSAGDAEIGKEGQIDDDILLFASFISVDTNDTARMKVTD